VRDGYIKIASEKPERIKLIDASGSVEEIHNKIVSIVMDFIKPELRKVIQVDIDK